MELDRKVREFPIPAEAAALLEDLKTPQEGEEPLPPSVTMPRFVLSHSREVSECQRVFVIVSLPSASSIFLLASHFFVASENAERIDSYHPHFSTAVHPPGLLRPSNH